MTQLLVKHTFSRIKNIFYKIHRVWQAAIHGLRVIWLLGRSLAMYPIPQRHYARAALYPQAVIIVSCLFCFRWWPLVPTVAIAVLGVMAVIMTVRADKFSNGERVFYVLIAFVLFYVEIRAVYKDRDQHDSEQARARAEQLSEFGKIANGISRTLEASDRQFKATMARSHQIIAGISDDMRLQTGGDSFAFLTFTPESGNVKFSHFPTALGPQFLVSITSHGKYPLRDIHAIMMDDERRLEVVAEYNKHPDGNWMEAIQSSDTRYQFPYLRPQSRERPTGDVELLGVYPLPKGDSTRISIAFSSLNGDWNETLHVGRINGVWHQCLSVLGPTVKHAANPFIYCDSDWREGRALAEKDWPRPKQPSPHR